jgi:hypothetical protein
MPTFKPTFVQQSSRRTSLLALQISCARGVKQASQAASYSDQATLMADLVLGMTLGR